MVSVTRFRSGGRGHTGHVVNATSNAFEDLVALLDGPMFVVTTSVGACGRAAWSDSRPR